MSVQQTLVLIKPDAIKRNLAGNVLAKLQESKLTPIGIKLVRAELELAKAHYAQHEGKGFYPQLLEYITGKLHATTEPIPVLALVYEGENAIQTIRQLAGDTNPEKSLPTTVRGMFGRITTQGVFENVLHASATPIEAEREIKLWFKPQELLKDIFPTKQDGKEKAWAKIPSVSELG